LEAIEGGTVKHLRGIWLVVVLLGLAACGEATGSTRLNEADDTLFLRSGSGVTVVEAGSSSPSFQDARAIPSGNWSTVVHGENNGDSTRVVATDPVTGDDLWADVLPGRLKTKIVSLDGELVALGPQNERFYSRGRSETRLTIAGRRLAKTRSFVLKGNYEPEAFSTDGDSMFIIKYIPAAKPTMYQVRRLDLTNGKVLPVYTPHEELQETMGGTARIQTASADGTRLYTLYTVGGANSAQYAFIHVLSLDEEWAHCIDLPGGFAEYSDATALAVSPDNERLYVVNRHSGSLVAIDTMTMQVVSEERSSFPEGETHAVAGEDALYVATGDFVTAFNPQTLDDLDTWAMDEHVTGLQVSDDPGELYVGLQKTIDRLDVRTGKSLEKIDPPGIKRIRTFGPVNEFEEEPVPKCAC
jgi:outer membrane protein assembly factor BamB